MPWGREKFHALAGFEPPFFGLVVVSNHYTNWAIQAVLLEKWDGKVRTEFSLRAGFCEYVHDHPFGSYKDITLGTAKCVCLSAKTLRFLSLLCFLHSSPISQLPPHYCFSSCSSGICGVLPRRPHEAFGMWCLIERANIWFYCIWGRPTEQLFFKYIFSFYSSFIKKCRKKCLAGCRMHWSILRTSVAAVRCFWGLQFRRFGTDYWCHFQGSVSSFWSFQSK